MSRVADKTPITESPWYWALLFAVVSLAALAALNGKYGRRQSVIERKYQARQYVAGQQASASRPTTPAYSTADDPLIVVWPLAAFFGGMACVSLVMLTRCRLAGRLRKN